MFISYAPASEALHALLQERLAQWYEDHRAEIPGLLPYEYLVGLLDTECGIFVPKMAVHGTGRVGPSAAKPALAKQLADLPCGQVLIIVIICLLILRYLDLPSAVQDEIADLVTVLGGAIWVITKITKKK